MTHKNLLIDCLDAMKTMAGSTRAVIYIADRKTDEFDRLKNAVKKMEHTIEKVEFEIFPPGEMNDTKREA